MLRVGERLRLGGTLLKNIFGFHGMIGTSGTKMGKFFEGVAECQRALVLQI